MKRILIIAAPFGFGPASKALSIAEYLRERYLTAFSTAGNSVEFLRGSAARRSKIYSGNFKVLFPTRESLKEFDGFIAINHLPAIAQLSALGLASRSILVDSLATWRSKLSEPPLPADLSAYVVQDELREDDAHRPNRPANARVTAPILWPDEDEVPLTERHGVLLHVGGMTSPNANADSAKRITCEFIAPLVESLAQANQQTTILGNAEVLNSVQFASSSKLLANVSPRAALDAIGRARLLITTPGIGAIYEAMSKGTPTILLPPMNSTQLSHYQVLTKKGLRGVLEPQLRDSLGRRLSSVHWSQQTPMLIRLLSANAPAFLAMSRSAILPLLADSGTSTLSSLAKQIKSMRSCLSDVSPRTTLIDALDKMG